MSVQPLALRPLIQIVPLRGERVVIDSDLALLYGVPLKRLGEQVRRNRTRFPPDFMFQLTRVEFLGLGVPDVSGGGGRGAYRKYLPRAFTEQGVAMLSSVLGGERAVQVNIAIMRAFVRMRRGGLDRARMAARIGALERKTDARFEIVFDEMRRLSRDDAARRRRRIGFSPV